MEPAARAYIESEVRPMATNTAPRTSTWGTTGPEAGWTNWGKKARKNSATLGLVMPTRKASR
jgi:hypothetical protein